jgi:hypothetical protein
MIQKWSLSAKKLLLKRGNCAKLYSEEKFLTIYFIKQKI